MKNIKYWQLFSLLIFKDFTWDKFHLEIPRRKVHPIEKKNIYINNLVVSFMFSMELLLYKIFTN